MLSTNKNTRRDPKNNGARRISRRYSFGPWLIALVVISALTMAFDVRPLDLEASENSVLFADASASYEATSRELQVRTIRFAQQVGAPLEK